MARAPITPATKALDAVGVEHVVHSYVHDPGVSAFGAEAAEKLGVDESRVFKTLVVQLDDKQLAVAVVPVSGSLDVRALAQAAGCKRAALADTALAEKRTGYVRGGISPFGQRMRLATYLDDSALAYPTIFVSGGRRGLDIEVAPSALLHVLDGQRAPIARD
ncbi:Cys-tRNA(Pro)/Cys-tRNA(Cys) deacylase [Pseudoclavibacter sp. JAI123]|uniref:Cys-tRNA(Pro) deacylase n=1 Tax=Pseudoclavibacter sp. JAI123 TaxID=2723065 RepID=UPI0015CDFFBA|nr:Cys-tRNA(Pro) deacylase [Pseudoclavibacter sp. JAI123]NYF11906.1 Cys-tRNA(Pro)/Cys-tRNA(Cys) deacylase [Pseudoclavibacter sp. JAI123]